MKKLLLIFLTVLTASLAALADTPINESTFPDAKFRAYLLEQYPSGVITTAQFEARTKIDVSNRGIYDMKGVDRFRNLTYLECGGNYISSIDVRWLPKLYFLGLTNNWLTSIDVSQNDKLRQLYLSKNRLTTVSITNMTELQVLWLDNNSYLTSVDCSNNNLDNFLVTQCTALKTLKCQGNSNLLKIYGLESCTALTTLDCENSGINDLGNVENLENLQTLLASNIKCGGISLNGMSKLTKVKVSNCSTLHFFSCHENPALTSLDVTGCTAMVDLACWNDTKLGTITGLNTLENLKNLNCSNCNFTSLDELQDLSKLETVLCARNKLTSLSIKNKYNLVRLDCDHSPTLKKIVCSTNRNLNWIDITGNTGLTELVCPNNSAMYINGLGDCTALTKLDCRDCNINNYGLSGLENLTKLEMFIASNNNLQGEFELCNKSKLTFVRLSGNEGLTKINCSNNPLLTDLYVEDCTSLTELNAYNNKLTALDMYGCYNLESLYCYNNQLTELKLYQNRNPKLSKLYCYKNKISGDKMDALITGLPTRQASSPGEFRVIYNSGEHNVITDRQVTNAKGKNWIPKRYTGSVWAAIGSGLVGDVNGDGEVNIADVNVLIDMVLKNRSSAAADINGDGEVNIADVNVLIDMILSM
ncbi:MAG: leucine-rich repeat domain-containing protein [Muribaculaceae bacterium]|nr:leucine-rich repeat domain-containing protein [Muribaculaceae bacterium]